ncbi:MULTISPECIES: hypothetical protein [unclassified Mesorhizobium]|uniref:hypothetical protein n=1 Tax=unclassified Mesorhizobium TaxID=325217 RepID=UPI001125F08D|nr:MULTISPECIES: hypothetical protein [unclassified Mesorhizobium]TPL42649.1 hypothetical protein FJ961_08135 [Mesorhizobium sp. B2-4-5]TPL66652.1 hypothetical protein FJ949_09815 [Mesorhizobium sp. B2-4-1]
MGKFYVVTEDGRRYESDSQAEAQHWVEYAVKALNRIGAGIVITDWSPELGDFLRKLSEEYPRVKLSLSYSTDKI